MVRGGQRRFWSGKERGGQAPGRELIREREVFVSVEGEPCTEKLSRGGVVEAGSGDGCLRVCRVGMKSITVDLALLRGDEMLQQDFLAAFWMERCQDVTGIWNPCLVASCFLQNTSDELTMPMRQRRSWRLEKSTCSCHDGEGGDVCAPIAEGGVLIFITA